MRLKKKITVTGTYQFFANNKPISEGVYQNLTSAAKGGGLGVPVTVFIKEHKRKWFGIGPVKKSSEVTINLEPNIKSRIVCNEFGIITNIISGQASTIYFEPGYEGCKITAVRQGYGERKNLTKEYTWKDVCYEYFNENK